MLELRKKPKSEVQNYNLQLKIKNVLTNEGMRDGFISAGKMDPSSWFDDQREVKDKNYEELEEIEN